MTEGSLTRLHQILTSEGRSQAWLGRQLAPPVKRSTVCEWATGAATVPKDRRSQIAAALGRSVDDVFPAADPVQHTVDINTRRAA
jgi:hypothetical protein